MYSICTSFLVVLFNKICNLYHSHTKKKTFFLIHVYTKQLLNSVQKNYMR